jgi:hypothetical protein
MVWERVNQSSFDVRRYYRVRDWEKVSDLAVR